MNAKLNEQRPARIHQHNTNSNDTPLHLMLQFQVSFPLLLDWEKLGLACVAYRI